MCSGRRRLEYGCELRKPKSSKAVSKVREVRKDLKFPAAVVVLIAVSAALSAVLAQEKSKKEAVAEAAREVLYEKARCGKAKMEVANNLPVLHVYGTPGEMGKQYGTILKKLLVALEEMLEEEFGAREEVMMVRMMAPEIEKFIPQEYLSEMKAISKATGIDYQTILIVNGLVEIMDCSTIAAWGERAINGKIIFGRNLGEAVLPDISDKIGCVTVYHPEGKNAFASVGVVGIIGAYSAMNEKGLCIANTTSANAKQTRALQGYPPGLLYRHLVENCSTVEEAKSELKNLKHNPLRASTLMICDAANNALVAELGPGGVAFREPRGEIIYATNHFLTKEMKSTDVTCWRFEKFEELPGDKKISVFSMKRILRSVVQNGVTLQTIVFEPAVKKMHVAFHKHDTPAVRTRYFVLTGRYLFPGSTKERKNK